MEKCDENRLEVPRILAEPQKFQMLRELYLNEGWGYRRIAEVLQCSPTTCWKAIVYFGLREEKERMMEGKPKLPRRFQKEEELKQLIALYEEGVSIVKLSGLFECSEDTCKRALQASGHPIRTRKDWVRPKRVSASEKLLAEPSEKSVKDTTDEAEESVEMIELEIDDSAEELVLKVGEFSQEVDPNRRAKVTKNSPRRINNFKFFMDKTPESKKQALVEAYQSGATVSALAKRYKATVNVIIVFLKKMGIELQKEEQKAPQRSFYYLTEKEKRILFTLLSDGLTDEEIMQRMVVNKEQIKRYRRMFSNA